MHFYKLDETAGTTLADSGTAGARATRRSSIPAKATLTGAGVTLNPDAYADSLTGAYVKLPDNITAGMTELSVDYDIRIDPANVGDHHLWSFGRKTDCDATHRLRGLDLRLEHHAPAHRPERDDADHRRERAAIRDLRAARGRVEAPDVHAAAQRRTARAGPGVLYEDGVEIGRNTNLTVAAERQRGGHQLQLPRPLAGARALRAARNPAQLPGL